MERLKIMRKFLSLVLIFMILLTMTACHNTMTEREREENNSKVDKDNISYIWAEGILIYEKSTGKLSTVIDTWGLGFKYTQGDEAILEDANNEYLIIYKANENKGYIYSFKENALSKIDDITKANINKLMYSEVDMERFKKIESIIGFSSAPIMYKDNYFLLKINYDNLKNSYVHVLDEKFNEVLKFRLGDK